MSEDFLRDAFWRCVLLEELDRKFLSPLRTRCKLLPRRQIHCNQGAKIRVAKKVNLRIAKTASVEIRNGTFYVGFQPRNGRRLACYDRCIVVVHPNGNLKILGEIELGAGSCFGIGPGASCTIGSKVSFAPNSFIVCNHSLSIGSDCIFSWGLTILDDDLHKITFPNVTDRKEQLREDPSIKIGARVWTGHHVTILKGVSIGDGVIIGACSVVTKNIPDRCIVAGNPARIIKEGVEWEK